MPVLSPVEGPKCLRASVPEFPLFPIHATSGVVSVAGAAADANRGDFNLLAADGDIFRAGVCADSDRGVFGGAERVGFRSGAERGFGGGGGCCAGVAHSVAPAAGSESDSV